MGVADLKGTRPKLLYSSENLHEKYREKYEKLMKSDLLTGKTYSMKKNLLDLFTVPSIDDMINYRNSLYS